MSGFFEADVFTTLLQVILIDLVLAGDNAIVIGLAAAGLPAERRRRAILVGIVVATALRVAFALVATQLLQVLGLLLAGGILLLWVCWKIWRELRTSPDKQEAGESGASHGSIDSPLSPGKSRKTLGQAVMQIVAADVSMSLDNVLAVAGAAREHPVVLGFGLMLSVALMGIAADLLGRLLQGHRWIAYVGLATILYVAGEMIYRGTQELALVLVQAQQ